MCSNIVQQPLQEVVNILQLTIKSQKVSEHRGWTIRMDAVFWDIAVEWHLLLVHTLHIIQGCYEFPTMHNMKHHYKVTVEQVGPQQVKTDGLNTVAKSTVDLKKNRVSLHFGACQR